jgi:hypothetical protein
MKTLYVKKVEGQTNLELLEQIYTKVKLGDHVKFDGRAYHRTRTLNTMSAKYPYHFIDFGDIYDGSFLIEDDDGEDVKTLCQYKVAFI